MRHQNSVFSQLLKVIPRHRFERLVAAHRGDFRARTLRCWDQFVALLYAQLTGCESLRTLETSFNSHTERHYHLGCQKVARSTLSDANERRPVALYEALFHGLLGQLMQGQNHAKEALLLLDSTTMPLNQNLFGWADFRSRKNGVKLHLAYNPKADTPCFFSITPAKKHDMKAAADMPIQAGAEYVFDRAYNAYDWWQELHELGCIFTTRMKKNAQFSFVEFRVPQGDGVLADDVIQMEKGCTAPLRRIVYHCPLRNKRLVFVTNAMERPALEVANRYRERWQIELFFKWVKQHLRIKKFLGTSENAVKIQIIIALIAYLILRIIQQTKLPMLTLHQLANLTKANIFQRKTWQTLLKPPDKTNNINTLIQLKMTLC